MRDRTSLLIIVLLGSSVFLSLTAMVHGSVSKLTPWADDERSAVLIPWADYERTSAIGPVNYRLEAVCDSSGFEYELNTLPSEEGGGIIGGGGVNISIGPIHKTYPEVKGEFLENMGVLYDSYNEKEYKYKLVMRDPPEDSGVEWTDHSNPSAYLNVNLRSELIPWWVKGFDQRLKVEITYDSNDLEGLVEGHVDRKTLIRVTDVRVMAKTDYSKQERAYRGEDVELYSSGEVYSFDEVGGSQVISIDARYPDETNVAGLYLEISANMTDHWGRPELASFSGGANTINIYPMEKAEVAKGMGIPLSWYMMMISYWLVIATIVSSAFRGKWTLGTLVPAAAFSILSPLWFFIGMKAAVSILGKRLEGAEEGLTWGPGFYIAILAAVLLTAALCIAVIIRVRENKKEPEPGVSEGRPSVFKVVGED